MIQLAGLPTIYLYLAMTTSIPLFDQGPTDGDVIERDGVTYALHGSEKPR